ncbi:MAG: FGGY-family carbohydrate kinase [Fusobacteriaceae bacterium]
MSKETKYIIGVDGGSQSSKVTIFDLMGNVICEAKEDLKPMLLTEGGNAEHPDDDLWDSIVVACKKVMSKFTGNKSDIIGLGLCTIRCCKVMMKENGDLAQPVMSWMDARVYLPHVHDNKDTKYITTTTGYMTHRFTGEKNDTAANCCTSPWPFDSDKWNWSSDEEAFKKMNIPKDMLFNLQMPGDISGYVTEKVSTITGIPAGIPVIATANDKAVEALGSGALDENTVLVSLGTYITSMMHGHENIKTSTNYWSNLACQPNKYLYESGGIRRGMWTVSWLKNLLGDEVALKAKNLGIAPEEYMNKEAAKISAGSEGLMTVLEWLPPHWEPFRRGIMIGFDGRHGAAHMYRSILEGIAFTMKNHIDTMSEETGSEVKRLILSGGGSNSDLLMQIFADVFGVKTYRNIINGAAGLGAAISVAVGLKYYSSYEEAIEKMVKVKDCFNPIEENTEIYSKLNKEVYINITKHTDEVLKKSYNVLNKK